MTKKLFLSGLAFALFSNMQVSAFEPGEAIAAEQNTVTKGGVTVIEYGRSAGNRASRSTSWHVRIGPDFSLDNGQSSLSALSGIGIGYSGLVENLGNLSLPEEARWMDLRGNSINVTLTMLEYRYAPVYGFALGTGLDWEFNNFRFRRPVRPQISPEGNDVVPEDIEHLGVKRTKLTTMYMNVPLTAHWRFGRNTELYGGVIGGWRIGSHTKIKTALEGRNRQRNHLNLRNFHYGFTAGFNFNCFGVYATYYPHSIFKPDMGPEVQHVNVGLRLNFGDTWIMGRR